MLSERLGACSILVGDVQLHVVVGGSLILKSPVLPQLSFSRVACVALPLMPCRGGDSIAVDCGHGDTMHISKASQPDLR